MNIPGKVIGRLSLYRRLLTDVKTTSSRCICSYDLANLAGVTAAQVRRDIMNIGYSGNPNRGYDVAELVESIGKFIDEPGGQFAALIGTGNLGRAILAFFSDRRPLLKISAAFDIDPKRYGRVIRGCHCYPMDMLGEIRKELGITIGIVTVPASEAQKVTDILVSHGILGIVNFVPVPLKAPASVYIEDIDMTMSLEKAAYFARKPCKKRMIH